ncbi:MAG: hypothetical protein IKM35_01325 [Bacteroidaceae bacterium]|nr:hypothetical protein [Bacteroidaceae bacterium]
MVRVTSWSILLGAVVVLMMMGCNLAGLRAYENVRPLNETAEPIDKARFVAYLDTAAIDDWEGVWLLMGKESNCYVMLERVNDYVHGSFYTHRIRLWSGNYRAGTTAIGAVIGYLEQGVSDDLKRITLFEGYVIPRRDFTSFVRLDDDGRYILFGSAGKDEGRDSEYNRMGMKRVYPQRSSEEEDYKVRYL